MANKNTRKGRIMTNDKLDRAMTIQYLQREKIQNGDRELQVTEAEIAKASK